jgi:hypothetical protein
MTDSIRDELAKAFFEWDTDENPNHPTWGSVTDAQRDIWLSGADAILSAFAVSRRSANHAELIAEAKKLDIYGEWVERNGQVIYAAQLVWELVAALEAVTK